MTEALSAHYALSAWQGSRANWTEPKLREIRNKTELPAIQ